MPKNFLACNGFCLRVSLLPPRAPYSDVAIFRPANAIPRPLTVIVWPCAEFWPLCPLALLLSPGFW